MDRVFEKLCLRFLLRIRECVLKYKRELKDLWDGCVRRMDSDREIVRIVSGMGCLG